MTAEAGGNKTEKDEIAQMMLNISCGGHVMRTQCKYTVKRHICVDNV